MSTSSLSANVADKAWPALAKHADRLAGAVVALCVFVVYLPVLVVPFAFLDDYTQLAWVHGFDSTRLSRSDGLADTVWRHWAQSGRPLAGLLVDGAYSLVSIDSLRAVRLVSVVGIALLGLVLLRVLTNRGMNRWLATATAIVVVTLPSFQVYASWAVLFTAPWAALLSVCASLLAGAAVARQRGRARAGLGAAASLALLCALLLYQPAAMFFWVVAAITTLHPGTTLRRACRVLAGHVAVAIPAAVASYAIFKAAVHRYGGLSPQRSSLTHDVIGKLRWFVEQPLDNSLNVSDLTPSRLLAATVALSAFAGLLLLHRERGWESVGYLALAGALIPLAYLPNLVIEENWASYRTVDALAALMVVYLALGIWGVRRAFRQVRVPWAMRYGGGVVAGVALVACVLGATALAAKNVTSLFVKPQSAELQFLRRTLAASGAKELSRVVLVRSAAGETAPLVRYDEFGRTSTSATWVPDPAVYLVLREEGRPTKQLTIDDLPSDATSVPASQLLVDMRKLHEYRVGWSWWTLSAARESR